ncbi:hypothetical protein MNBD_ALPHA11-1253 [hydrothermal vent metagenome]|uniref:Uncharacterized protein n=1 Tax=hydrothermal vent metagenome TaxID=652676 RepID=A0A3B0UK42_9ZZZZ
MKNSLREINRANLTGLDPRLQTKALQACNDLVMDRDQISVKIFFCSAWRT